MPNDPAFQAAPARRRLPLRYLLAAILALLLLPFLGWLAWNWIESTRLERALDALEARREPLDLDEFNVKPTTADQREASHLYAQARNLIGGMPIVTDQAAALGKTIEVTCQSEANDAGQPGRIHILRAFEDRYAAIFDLIDRAGRLDPVGWDDADRPQRHSMDEMQSITAARANVVRIARLACTGDSDAAAAALLSTLRLRQMWYSAAPVPIQTVNSLQIVLSSGTVSAPLLEQIQREFTSMADDRALEKWMLRDRAVWLSDAMPGVFTEQPPGLGQAKVTPVQAVATRLLRPLRRHRMVAELAEFDQAIEVAKQPWPGKIDAVAAFASRHPANRSQSMRRDLIDEMTRPDGEHVASGILASYIGVIAEALARARVSIAAVAVARHRHDHAGNLPSSLEQLIPDYLPALPIDPYNGAALAYRQDASGFKIYSVGVNRKDDSGTWEQHSDLQTMRRGNPPDIGISVASPSRRAD